MRRPLGTNHYTRMDYLAYAYLQLGQDQKARAVVDEIMAFKKVVPDTLAE